MRRVLALALLAACASVEEEPSAPAWTDPFWAEEAPLADGAAEVDAIRYRGAGFLSEQSLEIGAGNAWVDVDLAVICRGEVHLAGVELRHDCEQCDFAWATEVTDEWWEPAVSCLRFGLPREGRMLDFGLAPGGRVMLDKGDGWYDGGTYDLDGEEIDFILSEPL